MEMQCGKLKMIEHYKGNMEDFFTAKLIHNEKTFNITYDCNKSNLIIHEWYNLTKDEIVFITDELSDYFLSIKDAA